MALPPGETRPRSLLSRLGWGALGAVVIAWAIFFGFAIFYWLPWPETVRRVAAVLFPLAVLIAWFAPTPWRLARRGLALALLAAITLAYEVKTPAPQDWVPLMAKSAYTARVGDRVTIFNFRDAAHARGEAPKILWTTDTVDLSRIEGADLILQPFGNLKGLAHVMLTFRFADGRHVIVSMEARQAEGAQFDPIAGFFRRDPVYPILATERDLIYERLARTPPDPVQIYPLIADPVAIRAYFERVLDFVDRSAQQPIFYSTLWESCMTTFINLAPEIFMKVPWYDVRRWVPGYSLSLFQQLGLVDASVPADVLAVRRELPFDLTSPQHYASDAAWSAYIRQSLTDRALADGSQAGAALTKH